MGATPQGRFARAQVEAAKLQCRAMALQTARGQNRRDVAVEVCGGNAGRAQQQD